MAGFAHGGGGTPMKAKGGGVGLVQPIGAGAKADPAGGGPKAGPVAGPAAGWPGAKHAARLGSTAWLWPAVELEAGSRVGLGANLGSGIGAELGPLTKMGAVGRIAVVAIPSAGPVLVCDSGAGCCGNSGRGC